MAQVKAHMRKGKQIRAYTRGDGARERMFKGKFTSEGKPVTTAVRMKYGIAANSGFKAKTPRKERKPKNTRRYDYSKKKFVGKY